MMRYLLCLLMLVSGATQAGEYTAKVIAVLDGDTLLVTRGGKPLKLRLAGIDAPEKAQPYGPAAQQTLAERVMGQTVQVVTRAKDDYGRTVADVFVAGQSVNQEQVRRGMAWEYSRYHNDRAMLALQFTAQQQKRGLWAGDTAIEPALWRRQHPRSLAATPGKRASISTCGDKRYCSQMSSCEEAKLALLHCGPETLDGDRDGVPCERLCNRAR